MNAISRSSGRTLGALVAIAAVCWIGYASRSWQRPLRELAPARMESRGEEAGRFRASLSRATSFRRSARPAHAVGADAPLAGIANTSAIDLPLPSGDRAGPPDEILRTALGLDDTLVTDPDYAWLVATTRAETRTARKPAVPSAT